MGDPRFERSVILIVKHDPSGALGIVINKRIGEPSIVSVFQALGQNGGDISGTVRVFSGGLVQPEIGFAVHSADYRRPEFEISSGAPFFHYSGTKLGTRSVGLGRITVSESLLI